MSNIQTVMTTTELRRFTTGVHLLNLPGWHTYVIRPNDPAVYQGRFEKFEYTLDQPAGYTLETIWQAPATERIVFTRVSVRVQRGPETLRFILPGVCWLGWRSTDPAPGWTMLDAVEWLSHNPSRDENTYSMVTIFFSKQPMSDDMMRVLLG